MLKNLKIYIGNCQRYYECLHKYDETEELHPLYEFFKDETEKTWKKALTLARGMQQERKGLSDFA